MKKLLQSVPAAAPVNQEDNGYTTTLLDLYQAAWLVLCGFAMTLTMSGNRVAFSFLGNKSDIDRCLDTYFLDSNLQQYVSNIRNLKIALHERLRREGI